MLLEFYQNIFVNLETLKFWLSLFCKASVKLYNCEHVWDIGVLPTSLCILLSLSISFFFFVDPSHKATKGISLVSLLSLFLLLFEAKSFVSAQSKAWLQGEPSLAFAGNLQLGKKLDHVRLKATKGTCILVLFLCRHSHHRKHLY